MKDTIKGATKSWTSWFGTALIVLPFVQQEWATWGGLIPEEYRNYVLSLIGLVVLLLRFKTKQSLAEKGRDTGSS